MLSHFNDIFGTQIAVDMISFANNGLCKNFKIMNLLFGATPTASSIAESNNGDEEELGEVYDLMGTGGNSKSYKRAKSAAIAVF